MRMYVLLLRWNGFDDFGRVAGDDGVGRDVFSHDRCSGYHCILADRLTEQVIRDAGRTVAGDMLYAVGHASREEELQRMVAELIILAVERDKTGSG